LKVGLPLIEIVEIVILIIKDPQPGIFNIQIILFKL